MIGLVGFAYIRNGSGRKVMRIGRRCVVLKGLMVRHVVVRRRSREVAVSGGAVGKATLEPTPGDALVIEQVAHVLARHGDGVVRSGDAVVESRARVGDHGSAGDLPGGGPHVADHAGAVRLA